MFELLSGAGFGDVKVEPKEESRAVIAQWMPGSGAENFVISANISAVKPAAAFSKTISSGAGASQAFAIQPPPKVEVSS